MRKYGSGGQIVGDQDGEPEPIRRTASRPLTEQDVVEIEREDGPAVQEPEQQ